MPHGALTLLLTPDLGLRLPDSVSSSRGHSRLMLSPPPTRLRLLRRAVPARAPSLPAESQRGSTKDGNGQAPSSRETSTSATQRQPIDREVSLRVAPLAFLMRKGRTWRSHCPLPAALGSAATRAPTPRSGSRPARKLQKGAPTRLWTAWAGDGLRARFSHGVTRPRATSPLEHERMNLSVRASPAPARRRANSAFQAAVPSTPDPVPRKKQIPQFRLFPHTGTTRGDSRRMLRVPRTEGLHCKLLITKPSACFPRP